jgi:hypothetical protein
MRLFDARFEVFIVTKIQVAIFWVVTLSFCGGSMVLRNEGILPRLEGLLEATGHTPLSHAYKCKCIRAL